MIDRVPVHNSWVVLVAASFGMAMTIPGQTVGVPVFLDSIISDLGLGRSAVSATYTLGPWPDPSPCPSSAGRSTATVLAGRSS